MKRLPGLCCFVLLSCSLSLARDYYVATDGSDANPGTIERPFATLEKARDTIRQSKARVLGEGGLSVYLRQGKYFRNLPFVLKTLDSGESGRPIAYRAYPGEDVRLIGGVRLARAWFAPVASSDAQFARLDPAARGKCLKADLAAHGIASLLDPLQAELSFNGAVLPVARWPNEGFARTTSAEDNITFGYDDPRPERWLAAAEAYAIGYWVHGWASRMERIASIDTQNKKITLAKPPSYGIAARKPYYILNLLEEIDRPGEWYLDRQKSVLYLWPPEGFETGELLLSSLDGDIVLLKDVSDIRIEGLTIETGCRGIEIWGHDNLIANCTIRNLRDNGVTISGERNGASGITVFGNVFYEISGRAVMCGGGRDNTIENNVIARCGSAHFTDRRGKVWIDKDESWKLLAKIERYNHTQPPWSERYPKLAHILDNGYEQAKEPEGCVIARCVGWQNKRWLEKNSLGGSGGFDFYTFIDNIEDQDPRFVDEQSLNLALRDDSPAYKLPGFQRIPFGDIGPQ